MNIIKKQSSQIFSAQDIANVFAKFSQSELFLNEGYSTDWIWNHFNLMEYFLHKNPALNLSEIENILNLSFEKENFPPQIEASYQWLRKKNR